MQVSRCPSSSHSPPAPPLPPADAPGQYGAYFYDDGFLALPGRVFSRR